MHVMLLLISSFQNYNNPNTKKCKLLIISAFIFMANPQSACNTLPSSSNAFLGLKPKRLSHRKSGNTLLLYMHVILSYHVSVV